MKTCEDKPSKILFLNGYSTGSTNGIITTLIPFFKKANFNVFYGCRDKVFCDCPSYQIMKNDFEERYYKAVTRFFGLEGFSNQKTTKKLLQWIDQVSPDIICLENPHPYYLNVPLLIEYITKKNIPLVWTLHDEWVLTGRCCSPQQCQKWESGCGHCPNKRSFPMQVFGDSSRGLWHEKRKLINGNPLISFVSPSEWLLHLFESPKSGYHNDCSLIRNPIDPAFVFSEGCQTLLKESKGRILVGSASFLLTKSKGISYLSNLADKLNPQRFYVVAVGQLEYKGQISKNLHIKPAIKDKHELARFYSSLNVFVNPTLADNAPLVNSEALACGTPVVSFATGGSAEMLIAGKNGFSVPRGDAQKLVEAITQITSTTKSLLSSYCINSVEQQKPEKVANAYIELIRKILKDRHH